LFQAVSSWLGRLRRAAASWALLRLGPEAEQEDHAPMSNIASLAHDGKAIGSEAGKQADNLSRRHWLSIQVSLDFVAAYGKQLRALVFGFHTLGYHCEAQRVG
jgi:hypothetical protein